MLCGNTLEEKIETERPKLNTVGQGLDYGVHQGEVNPTPMAPAFSRQLIIMDWM
jgi:hypothetical protein